MIRILQILALIIVLSCGRDEFSTFNAKNFVMWSTVVDFEILDMSLLNTNVAIERPVLTWKPLLRLKILAKDAVDYKYHCLYYRVPYRNKKGILKVVETEEKCVDPVDKKEFSLLGGIEKLKIFFFDKKKRLDEGKILEPLTLYFHMQIEGIDKWPEFPFVNLKKGREKKRYASSIIKRKYPGLIVWPARQGRVDFEKRATKIDFREGFLGKIDDDYSKGEAVVCHKIDDQCNTIGKMNCNRCRYGHFEAAGSSCTDTNIKICGINRCGKSGWPACPRGKVALKTEGCVNGSAAGFCEPGLRAFCDENKILVCL